MEKVFTDGLTEKFTMANGFKGSNMGMVCGLRAETATSANGETVKLKVSVFRDGKTETDMKESGNSVLSTVTEQISSQTEMSTRVTFSRAKRMVVANTLGMMPLCMWVSSRTA